MKKFSVLFIVLTMLAASVKADLKNLPTYKAPSQALHTSSSQTVNSYGAGGPTAPMVGLGKVGNIVPTVSFSSTAVYSTGALASPYGSYVQIHALSEDGVADTPYEVLRARGGTILPPGDDEDDEWQPIGDAVWPLMLMLLGYVGYARIRRRRSEAEA